MLIEEKRKEEKKKRKEIEEKRKEYNTNTTQKFQKPTLEDVIEYCNERNNGINAEHFIDFYESKGWKVGNQPMKDWKASIRTWEKNNYDNNTNKSSGNLFFDILKKEGKL